MRLIVIVVLVAVLVVAIVDVLQAVQAVLGAWSAMNTAMVVQAVIGVPNIWLVPFHVLEIIIMVVLHLEIVSLDAIDVLVVAFHAMMYIVGVIGLQVVVAVAEMEMENNVQVMFNYLNNIHYYNKNIYNNSQHSFQYIHYSYSNWHNLDNILHTYSSLCDNLNKSH